jgi:ubiquinone biosynthesis protein UbiJ
MKDPFDLVIWAIAIGIAWVMLTSFTGIDEWLKKLAGRKDSVTALNARVEALEKRIVELEEKRSSVS